MFLVSFIAMAAIGQEERSSQQENRQIASCQAAMQVILKHYNNARYAVQRARNSGDVGHILSAVNEAQLALDTMEQPLKVCNEAVQNVKSDPPSSKN